MQSISHPWTIKHLPSSSQFIIGRDEELKEVKDFLDNFPQKKRSLLLYGPCGSGKTSFVHAIAKERNFELLELNASDARNKDQILEKIKPAIEQRSFFYDGKIILVDEIDGLSGHKDRGGAVTLASLIKSSPVPIILTANDIESDKLKPVLKESKSILFDRLSSSSVFQILQAIAKKENITVQDSVLRALSIQSDGDVRAAINDFETICQNGSCDETSLEVLSQRKRTQSIQGALTCMYKSTLAQDGIRAFDEVDEDIDQRILWIDYNTPFEYTKPVDLARAYGALSRADVFLGRIKRNQQWRFWVYASELMSGGVTISKDSPYKKHTVYKQTSRLLKIWQINMSMAKRKSIAQKIAKVTHQSLRQAYAQVEFVKIMCQNKEVGIRLGKTFDLDEDEQAWLRK